MLVYEVRSFFDVWGNEEEGYTVNDSTVIGEIIVEDNVSDDEVLEALRLPGWLQRKDLVYVEDLGVDIEILDKKNHRPYFGLRLVEG